MKLFLAYTDYDDDDSLIQSLIAGQRSYAEHLLGFSLVEKEITEYFASFPEGSEDLYLVQGPIKTVASIQYTDPDGATQTLPTSVYRVETLATTARIKLVDGETWPETIADDFNAVVVDYTVQGYAGKLRDLYIIAVKRMVAEAFERREDKMDQLENRTTRAHLLLQQGKRWSWGK